MAKTEEGKIQDAVIKYGNRYGVRTIRMYFGPGIQTGWPDVLFLIPGGRPLFIEFKKPGEKPTAKQRIKIALLEEAEYDVEVHDTILFATAAIDDAIDRAAALKKPRLSFRKTKYKVKK